MEGVTLTYRLPIRLNIRGSDLGFLEGQRVNEGERDVSHFAECGTERLEGMNK